VKEALDLMDAVSDNVIMIMTGTERCEELWEKASRVTEVKTLKETVQIQGKQIL
jgi:ATP:corrinoid adenosyltransferase